MSNQCALDKSGGLKEAIEFFFSESETMPLRSSTASALLKQNSGNNGESYTLFKLSLLFYSGL